MSRDAVDSGSATHQRRARAFAHVFLGALLTALSTGCVSGTSGASKFSLFAKNDQEVDTGTASMEPAPVCPNCSMPPGVVAQPTQSGSHADGHDVRNSQMNPQMGPFSQTAPGALPVAQVPPEGMSMLSVPANQPGAVMAYPPAAQAPSPVPAAPQMPMPAQVAGQVPVQTQAMVQSPAYPVQPQAMIPQGAVSQPAPRGPDGRMTWEQLQAEQLRTQHFYSAQSRPTQPMSMPQQQVLMPQTVPWQAPVWQAPVCPPGMQAVEGFAGAWHANPPPQTPEGAGCPPAETPNQWQACQDQITRLNSKVEELARSNEKYAETISKQNERNRKLEAAQEADRQVQLEYFDALLNTIGEQNAEQSREQPEPQASNRRERPGRPSGQTASRPVSQTRTQPVTLPPVNE